MSFRSYLQDELIRRCKKNPGYSVRSYARALTISPSSLSRMLRGERKISDAMKLKLGARLGIPSKVLESLENNFEKQALKAGDLPEQHYAQLKADHFAIISDWYHYAILELAHVQGFEPNPRWIARSLGITVAEAQLSIDRLVRVGLISICPSGSWTIRVKNNTNFTDELTVSAAARSLQRQVLEKALAALEETPLERRDQTSMTMAIDSKKLPAAIEKISKFRRELCAFLQTEVEPDEVYHLSISLYPVTANYVRKIGDK